MTMQKENGSSDRRCPDCNLNWWLFPPAHIHGLPMVRCVECKRVYDEDAVIWTSEPHLLPATSPIGPGWWRAVEYSDGKRGRQVSHDGQDWKSAENAE